MQEFEVKDGVLLHYSGNEKIVRIPDTVKKIGRFFSMNNTAAEEIELPASLEEMDSATFFGFENLAKISVAKEISHFSSKDGVLFNKTKSKLLYYPVKKKEKEYIIPNSVTIIEISAFSCGAYLQKLTISKNVSKIVFWNFDHFKHLELIISPENPYFCVKDDILFSKDGKELLFYPAFKEETKYVVPDTVRILGRYAFYSDTLQKIALPENLKEIRDYPFQEVPNLKIINLPEKVRSIAHDLWGVDNRLEILKMQDSYTGKNPKSFIYQPDYAYFQSLQEIKQLHAYSGEKLRYIIPFEDYFHSLTNIMNLVHSHIKEKYQEIFELLSPKSRAGFILSRLCYDEFISKDNMTSYLKYLPKHAKYLIKYVIEKQNEEYIRICEKYGVINKNNITFAIDYAGEQKSYSIRSYLMNLKYEKF